MADGDVVLCFGNNSDGQLGCGLIDDEEQVFEPVELRLEGVRSCGMSLKHSIWLTADGSLEELRVSSSEKWNYRPVELGAA